MPDVTPISNAFNLPEETRYGYCGCGCGQKTSIYPTTNIPRGMRKGEPAKYLKGHHQRTKVKFIILENGCWQWVGCKTLTGYGQVHCSDGPRNAYAVIWESVNGPTPDGKELDHLCRNRACVNPSHLEPVTHRENLLRGHRWRKLG